MPLYEYSCPHCGSAFEAMRKSDERDREIACPSCGAAATRLLSTAAVLGGGLSRSVPEWRPAPNARPLTPATQNCCGGGCHAR